MSYPSKGKLISKKRLIAAGLAVCKVTFFKYEVFLMLEKPENREMALANLKITDGKDTGPCIVVWFNTQHKLNVWVHKSEKEGMEFKGVKTMEQLFELYRLFFNKPYIIPRPEEKSGAEAQALAEAIKTHHETRN